jgi:hypothetical protein
MKLEETNTRVDDLIEMSPREIGELIRQQKMGDQVMTYLQQLPYLELKATVQPVTRTVLKVDVSYYFIDRCLYDGLLISLAQLDDR